MPDRSTSRVVRAAASRVRGLLGAAGPRYAVTVDQAGQLRTLEMDTATAARVARRLERRADGALVFDFAPGAHAYLVQRGNPARFGEPHRKAAFANAPVALGPHLVRINARLGEADHPEAARLYVQYYDAEARRGSFPLTLRGASQTMSFRAPGGLATIAIRLAGSGILGPLTLGVKFETEGAAGRGDGAGEEAIAPFDRLALFAAGAASRVAGIYDPDAPDLAPVLAGRHLGLRPDQDVPLSAALPVAGLVFDDTAAMPFGWQGTFDENSYANLALARVLGQMERAGLPTVLVYDERTETKPLFPELSALFTSQLRKGPEAAAGLAGALQPRGPA